MSWFNQSNSRSINCKVRNASPDKTKREMKREKRKGTGRDFTQIHQWVQMVEVLKNEIEGRWVNSRRTDWKELASLGTLYKLQIVRPLLYQTTTHLILSGRTAQVPTNFDESRTIQPHTSQPIHQKIFSSPPHDEKSLEMMHADDCFRSIQKKKDRSQHDRHARSCMNECMNE